MKNKLASSQAQETVKVLSKTAQIDKKQQKIYCKLLTHRCRNLEFKTNLEYFHSLLSLGTSVKLQKKHAILSVVLMRMIRSD